MSSTDPFQELVDGLRRVLATNPPASTPAITFVTAAVTPSPPVYARQSHGQTSALLWLGGEKGFLLQCSLVLEMQPHLYPDDRCKVAFIISQLNGRALQWAETIWSQDGPVTQSLTSFITHFKEFRTLSAASGWNEQSLITTYRQGLDPRVWLHLTAYEDTIGLERFIQLSIRVATRMQSCLEEHQGQPPYSPSLRQPESISPPEPGHEPMQLENNRLTLAEQQRQLSWGLCLYCGATGHVFSTCPIRPPRPMVSAILPSIKRMKPLTTIVLLTAVDVSIQVNALLDSGSAGNFISGALCSQLKLKTTTTASIYQIHSITGKPLSLRHTLPRVGLHSRRPIGVPAMTPVHRRKRQQWVRKCQNWTMWKKVACSNESRFLLHNIDSQISGQLLDPPHNQDLKDLLLTSWCQI
ncbi:Retrotransposon-derived protein PEG10 [Anabarilius grahami]|uniref:Retrotransposon-derived protein PEG10 n=1 Tax=Anabarilius grahami TaxID=495550 RepID=A0A3N0Z1H5_ANAGA|nr:Retrotransposon-derived protein PEG10 [Anabarilius grahami]